MTPTYLQVITHRVAQHRVVLTGTDEVVTDVILALNEAGIRARQVSVESSSLEQAFLTLTSEDSPPASTDGAA